jgi:hypothetical protein
LAAISAFDDGGVHILKYGLVFIFVSRGYGSASFIYVSWIDGSSMGRLNFRITSPKTIFVLLIFVLSTVLLVGLSERGRSLTQEEEILSGVCTLLCILLAPILLIGVNLSQKNKPDVELQMDKDQQTE